jgi:hypothetical protein
MHKRTFITALLAAICAVGLFHAGSIRQAFAQSGFPIKGVTRLTTACVTVDSTTGGTRLPASPASNRVNFAMFNASANRVYCIPTTATSCSTPASVTNYGVILEPGAGADQLGTFWSMWLNNDTNFCCATVAGTTKVCTQEGTL